MVTSKTLPTDSQIDQAARRQSGVLITGERVGRDDLELMSLADVAARKRLAGLAQAHEALRKAQNELAKIEAEKRAEIEKSFFDNYFESLKDNVQAERDFMQAAVQAGIKLMVGDQQPGEGSAMPLQAAS